MQIKKLSDVKKTVSEQEIQSYLKKKAVEDITEAKFLGLLADEFAKIEQKNIQVTDFVMNADTYSDFRQLKMMDLEMKRNNLERGLFGYLWGARLWVQTSVPDGEVKLYGEGDEALNRDFPLIVETKKVLE